jgi:1-acyl-sn-glycerol-3-phosphate acyltransferase
MIEQLPRLADEILVLSPGIAAILIALFFVPLFRLISFPITCKNPPLIRMNALFGRWERFTGKIRDLLAPPYLAIAFGWNIYRWAILGQYEPRSIFLISSICALFLFVLNEFHRVWKRNDVGKLLRNLKDNPDTHPQDFIESFYATHGIIRCKIPQIPIRKLDPFNVDFRPTKNNGGASFLLLLRAILNVMWFSRLVILAEKFGGKDFAADVASSLAVIFSARLCQLAQAQVIIEGVEKAKDTKPPMLYMPNHTSAFDFIILPLLLAAHRKVSGLNIKLIPRFLLARDHFLDNFMLYRVVGVGRAAQIMDMVFVDRRKHGRDKTKQMVHEATTKLIEGTMPMVIYPQGSRARSKVSMDGSRMDGGYYTVGPKARLKREGGHVKKGVAFIATDAANALAKKNPNGQISLVPIAIFGAANVLPRKDIWVKRGRSVTIKVGDPIVIEPREAEHLDPSDESGPYRNFVNNLHERIDRSIKSNFRVHAELERRFFEDLRSTTDHHTLEELSIAMKQWRGNDYLVFVILDYIYTCKPKEWRILLGQLVHLILKDAPRSEFVAFRERLADKLGK